MRNTKSRYELQNTKYSWGRVQGEKEMEGTGKDEEEGPCDTGALWTVQLNQWNIFPQTIQLKFKTSCSLWLNGDNDFELISQRNKEDHTHQKIGHLCWKSRPAILCKCRVCILAFLLSIVFNKYTNSEKRLQTLTITMGMYYKYRWGGGAGRGTWCWCLVEAETEDQTKSGGNSCLLHLPNISVAFVRWQIQKKYTKIQAIILQKLLLQ